MNIALWIIAVLLALAFLLAGVMKAFRPLDSLKKNMSWVPDVPAAFVRFIGVAEILAAIGLILPAITGVQQWLVAAAAGGLVIVMLGAVIVHAGRKEWQNIGGNVVLLLLAAFIVIGRWLWSPF
jgi:putative oxidoreductase